MGTTKRMRCMEDAGKGEDSFENRKTDSFEKQRRVRSGKPLGLSNAQAQTATWDLDQGPLASCTDLKLDVAGNDSDTSTECVVLHPSRGNLHAMRQASGDVAPYVKQT